MDIRVTVARPDGGCRDLLVEVDAAPTLGELSEELSRAAGLDAAPTHWWVDGVPVGPDAVAGGPPLLDGVTLAPATRQEGTRGALRVVVTHGAEAGRSVRLGGGVAVLGRAAGADIRVDDPAVSRRHASIEVGDAGVRLRDLSSRNGTTVGGRLVADGGVRLGMDEPVRVGDSLVELRGPDRVAVTGLGDGAGGVLHNRSPRPSRHQEPVRLVAPRRETAATPRVQWSLLVVPVALTLLLVAVGGAGPLLLAMTAGPALTSLAGVGAWLRARRRRRKDDLAFGVTLAAHEVRVAAALAAERAERATDLPGPADLLEAARTRSSLLWRRRGGAPDALRVAVGIGSVPASLVIDGHEDRATPPLSEVPVALDLAAAGVVGVAGPRRHVLALTRWLVAQAVTSVPPSELRLAVLTPPSAAVDWRWTRWLPHAVDVPVDAADLAADLAARARLPGGSDEPWLLTVVERAAELRAVPGLTALLRAGPGSRVVVVCVGETVTELAVECAATVVVGATAPASVSVVGNGSEPALDVRVDGLDESRAEQLARALAPVREAGSSGGGLPASIRLLDLLDVDLDPAELVRHWQAPRVPQAVLGVGRGGPVRVDLDADGPHALVAGTTGSGKSELLRTLVASLAVQLSPAELAVLLVDFKGGSAFAGCTVLPHVVGVLTDLDGAAAGRALESLTAELRRRERLLAAAGARDLRELAERRPGALPRLLIVVDEFATLAAELGEFVGGLVGIAQRGRSLGIHLVLATQRPAGVVSADIRANTSLRIALRVAAPEHSIDLLDLPCAAAIPASLPGRAWLRASGGAVQLQCALLSTSWQERPRVRPWTRGFADQPVTAGQPTDLDRVVAATTDAARLLGLSRPPGPWLPPLPPLVALGELRAEGLEDGEPADGAAASAAPLGLLDRPSRQRREVYALDLAAGRHLAVVGGARSGRTTLLRSLAGSAAQCLPPERLHVHAVDLSGGLASLAVLPHCGTVARDADAAERLIAALAGEVAQRRRWLASVGAGSLDEIHGRAADPPPRLLLLVDGWEATVSALEELDGGRALETLHALLRDGPGAGLLCAASGGRALVTGRTASGFAERVVLALADPADAALAGVRPQPPGTARGTPPGRGMLAATGEQLQIAVLGGDATTAAQEAVLAAIATATTARRAAGAGTRVPFRLRPLPETVDQDRLPSAVVRCAEPLEVAVAVGIGGDLAEPVALRLRGDTAGALVVGPPRSGRSTALATLARRLLAGGVPVRLLAPRGGPLAAVSGCEPFEGAPQRGVVLVDDVDLAPDGPDGPALQELLTRPDRFPAVAVVVAAETSVVAAAFTGPLAAVRRSRPDGLLLAPAGRGDGEAFGLRLPRRPPQPPGRGLLVVAGVAVPVQVAR